MIGVRSVRFLKRAFEVPILEEKKILPELEASK
jgi:hypothetical protein